MSAINRNDPTLLSETARFRDLTVPYCQGSVLDIGAGEDRVVPWAITVDLPSKERFAYGARERPRPNLEVRKQFDLFDWFHSECFDTVYSSHLLEDFEDWNDALDCWRLLVKKGGHIVILIPDKERWNAAVAAGQSGNAAHKHEGKVGELTTYFDSNFWEVLHDELVDDTYTILFVARKK